MQGAKRRRVGDPARLCNAADRLEGRLSGTDEIVNTFLEHFPAPNSVQSASEAGQTIAGCRVYTVTGGRSGLRRAG
jgi:hypothetical protein